MMLVLCRNKAAPANKKITEGTSGDFERRRHTMRGRAERGGVGIEGRGSCCCSVALL